jgi:hypothetical protein
LQDLQLVAGKITLNLPRAAFRASRQRADSVEAQIEAAVDLAVKGLLERRHFVTRLAARPEAPLWELAELEMEKNALLVVGVIGLGDCVRFLTGTGLQGERPRRRGRELLALIEERVRASAQHLGANLLVEETCEREIGTRLSDNDARLYDRVASDAVGGSRREHDSGYDGDLSYFREASREPQGGSEENPPAMTEVELSRELRN